MPVLEGWVAVMLVMICLKPCTMSWGSRWTCGLYDSCASAHDETAGCSSIEGSLSSLQQLQVLRIVGALCHSFHLDFCLQGSYTGFPRSQNLSCLSLAAKEGRDLGTCIDAGVTDTLPAVADFSMPFLVMSIAVILSKELEI